MINAGPKTQQFGIHEAEPDTWLRAIDTALQTPNDISDFGHENMIYLRHYETQPQSVVVLIQANESRYIAESISRD